MAAEFIGLQMLVTLRDPPTRLKGTISAVEAGSGLTLSNVWILDTNKWEPRLTISASNIVDVSEVPRVAPTNPLLAAQAPTPPTVTPQTQPLAPPAKSAFIDPAIVAVGKRPGSLPNRGPDSAHHQPNTSEKRDPEPLVVSPSVQNEFNEPDPLPAIVVSESIEGLKIENQAAVVESADELPVPEVALEYGQTAVQKKKRRQRKTGNSKNAPEEVEASPQAPKTANRGKGWRQTPILQSTSSFQPFDSLKRNSARGRPVNDNGWASEDVTDVQEAGDFDFGGSLAKFDKQQIFEQMRKDDEVDEADRLVSHNRYPRPRLGTGGGKNLHYSENVLDTPVATLKSKEKPTKEATNDFWNSEADDGVLNGGERLSGRDMGSRQGSRRGESKVSVTRRSQSRKASGAATGPGPSRVNSGVSHYRTQSLKGSRPSSRLSTTVVATDKRFIQLSTPATAQGLYMLPSNRRVEPVSALQMLNLENIAHNEIGLTEEMMTENAGRGIAQVTLTALADPAIKVRHAGTVDPSSGNPPPQTVVVLAGNNKSGSRAVAAARHLRNKGINVLVCVVGLERGERDLLEDVRQQVRLYKNLGGRIFSKSDFFEHLRKISIPMLTIDTPRTSLSSLANPAPVMLIIDALLGLAISFEELRNGDQATVYELIEWANRNEAFVLAVDIPTGIDPSSGTVSVIDGNRLYVKPRYVVAVGAPKRGLVEAMMAAENDDSETVLAGDATLPDDAVSDWKPFLVDIGLGPAVWKKAGTKLRRGIDFDDKWVLEMRYQGLSMDEDELV
ncbi:YjeF-related protein N-terminus-domain-containing protein [Lasiosphaeria miniovina]|uniref:Enhancer of mRNA-decapping protein 3 n=1 Tax=Lasiosphaeria miniovina TaxID=1954250 RepID=A0AA40AV87_9PEZI|nr:YjeF-related protein N-terminus-domain-containing protein [Lasiosphaeria miniovina]KAK0722588.1 YjeF-related protein N-terminus-domain-containing protein [Lasiosphaeria miniovina]